MKKISIILFNTLFSITIYATTINTENSPFINDVKNKEYDYIMFTGNNVVFDVEQYANLKKATDDADKNSGNIIVSENTTATINAYQGTDSGGGKLDGVVYLQYTTDTNDTTTGYIKGADKFTSYLNLNGFVISTKNNTKQSLYIENINFTMTNGTLSATQQFIRGKAVKFENAIFNVKGSKTSEIKTTGTEIFDSTFTYANSGRNIYFKNTSINVDSGSTLRLTASNASAGGTVFNNATVSVNGTISTNSHLFFNDSTIDIKGAITHSDTKSVWKMTNTTFNVYSSLDFSAPQAGDWTAQFQGANKTTTINLFDNATMTNSNKSKIEKNVTLAINGKTTEGNAIESNASFSILEMYNNSTLSVSTKTASIMTLNVLESNIALNVASDTVLTIKELSVDSICDIELADELVRGALIICDEKMRTYSDESTRVITFVDEKGIERILDTNLFIDAVEGGWTVYTAQVPEPAQWATIFGVIALAFITYRKRR